MVLMSLIKMILIINVAPYHITSAATLQASSAPATATSSKSCSCQQRITPVRGLSTPKFLLFIIKIIHDRRPPYVVWL